MSEANEEPKIYTMSFSKIYPMYVAKAEKKGRLQSEVDEIIYWLTGYTNEELKNKLDSEVDFKTFIVKAPKLNPLRIQIKGSVCGVKIEEIKEPIMKEIMYLDKLIDELAKGKSIASILRK